MYVMVVGGYCRAVLMKSTLYTAYSNCQSVFAETNVTRKAARRKEVENDAAATPLNLTSASCDLDL